MGCCGETVAGRLTITQKEIDEGLALQVEYEGGRTVTVTGSATGATYTFSGVDRMVKVHPRDAPGMMANQRLIVRAVVRRR